MPILIIVGRHYRAIERHTRPRSAYLMELGYSYTTVSASYLRTQALESLSSRLATSNSMCIVHEQSTHHVMCMFVMCISIDKGGGEGLETAVIGAFLFFVYR